MELCVSILQLFIGLLFFAGTFCLFKRFLHCPDSLIPLVSSATIIILLMLGAFLNVLYPAMVMIFILGGLGCFSELFLYLKNKKEYVFFKIPTSWCIFFSFGIIFFIYSYGEVLGGCDSIHHWGIVQKGMMDYNSILDLPTHFRNYPVGMGVWGYFINHLIFGSKFRQDACLFAWLLLYVVAFSAIWNPIWDKRIVLKNIFCSISFLIFFFIGTSRMWNYSISAWFIWWTIAILLIGVASSYEIRKTEGAIEALKTIFLFLGIYYCCYSSAVTMSAILADLLFPFIAGCVLFFYLSNPRLKSFFWITPALSILFLIKRPGLFLAVAVAVVCILDYAIRLRIWRFFNPCKFTFYKKRISWSVFGVIFIGSMLALMPVLWKFHCSRHAYSSMFKTTSCSQETISAIFTKNTTPRIKLIREKFQSALKKNNVIFHETHPWYSLWVRYTHGGNKMTSTGWSLTQVITVSVIALAGMIVFLICQRQYRKALRLSLLSVGILFFCALYWFGLLYTYIYSFGDEGLQCVAFERYILPMLCLWEFFLLYVFSQIQVSSHIVPEVAFRLFLVAVTVVGVDSLALHRKFSIVQHPAGHTALHQQAKQMMTTVWPSEKKFDRKKILLFWNGKNPQCSLLDDVPCFFNLNSNYGNAVIRVVYRSQYKTYDRGLKYYDYIWWHVNEPIGDKNYFDKVWNDCPNLSSLPFFSGNNKSCIWEKTSSGFELVSSRK